MKRGFNLVVFGVIVACSVVNRGVAYPMGSGTCVGGEDAISIMSVGIHSTGGLGQLSEGNLTVSIGGIELSEGSDTNELPASDGEWSLVLERTDGLVFRGFLLRVSGSDGNLVQESLVVTDPGISTKLSNSDNPINGPNASCEQGVAAITHATAATFTSVSTGFIYSEAAEDLLLEVTVVESAPGPRWYYSAFNLAMVSVPNEVNVTSEVPSTMPSLSPSAGPSMLTSAILTSTPSAMPTTGQDELPSAMQITLKSELPSALPSTLPSAIPSEGGSDLPSEVPSVVPSELPSELPSVIQSALPSEMPSALPSAKLSEIPSSLPSALSSSLLSELPSTIPGEHGSITPSQIPSTPSSELPSTMPSVEELVLPPPLVPPTDSPPSPPSVAPSMLRKSDAPTIAPSGEPSAQPVGTPTTEEPTFAPVVPTPIVGQSREAVDTGGGGIRTGAIIGMVFLGFAIAVVLFFVVYYYRQVY